MVWLLFNEARYCWSTKKPILDSGPLPINTYAYSVHAVHGIHWIWVTICHSPVTCKSLQVFAKILFSLQDTVKLSIKKHIVLNLNPTCFCFMKVEESVKRAQRNKKNCFDLTSRVSVQMHAAFICLHLPCNLYQYVAWKSFHMQKNAIMRFGVNSRHFLYKCMHWYILLMLKTSTCFCFQVPLVGACIKDEFFIF